VRKPPGGGGKQNDDRNNKGGEGGERELEARSHVCEDAMAIQRHIPPPVKARDRL
jgi:hypothetical protein